MKSIQCIIGCGALATFLLLCSCEKEASLKSDQDKAGYAIGMQIGNSMKAQNAEVSVPAVALGLKDAYEGKESRLKPEEMQAAMKNMQETLMKKAQEASVKNLKDGTEWLAKNKDKAGVKTTASGLQFEVVKEGTGKQPTDDSIVKVHYTGTLTSGEKFDSSRDRNEPTEFSIHGVIPGWTEGLKLMKVGGQYKLAIPPNLAYGPMPRPKIPGNSVLLFDLELIDVKDAPKSAVAPVRPAVLPKKK